jgi:predicted translin family RNA/ssDNA-binding protein
MQFALSVIVENTTMRNVLRDRSIDMKDKVQEVHYVTGTGDVLGDANEDAKETKTEYGNK